MTHRRALDPRPEPVVLIDDAMIDAGIRASRETPRKRMIVPLHKEDAADLHRMLNVVQPGSYIRPHRHLDPPKAESLVVLRGSLVMLIFDEDGELTSAHRLPSASGIGIDLEPGVVHSFFAEEPDTVVFEVKPGPYTPATDKDFMPWAPNEADPGAEAYLADLEQRARALLGSGPE